MTEPVPEEWKKRSPLLTPAGWERLQAIRQHVDAPLWNFETGDRLIASDLPQIDLFRSALATASSSADMPPEWMLDAISVLRPRSWFLQKQLPVGFDLARDWAHLPTMSRDDLATRLVEVVPFDLDDFDRLLVYDTSGTSGHAVRVPHDPATLAKSQVLAEFAMQRHGASPRFSPDDVACLNLCAQTHTYVFASVFHIWEGAGFVKANLNERDWAGGPESARRFLREIDAQLLTSDPISLTEGMLWELDLQPRAVLSTAVGLAPELQTRLATHYGCPIIDWYSTTETGPIAFTAPDGDGWEVLPHDVHIEVVDDTGLPVAHGESGEICVTSLRNPFLPLVRYRTGDHAVLEREPTARLRRLQGRTPAFFRAADGGVVSAVDIGRAMRLVSTFAQHAFVQRADSSCVVRIKPIPGIGIEPRRIEAALHEVLGDLPVEVIPDDSLGHDAKVPAYRSELAP